MLLEKNRYVSKEKVVRTLMKFLQPAIARSQLTVLLWIRIGTREGAVQDFDSFCRGKTNHGQNPSPDFPDRMSGF